MVSCQIPAGATQAGTLNASLSYNAQCMRVFLTVTVDGDDKSSQDRDIREAKALARDL